jgi:dihydroorotate dehydrogenase (fumarate)
VAKPVLFKQKPDKVHERMVRNGSRIQRSKLVMKAAHAAWAYQNEPALSQTIQGIHFANPVGLSAGLDKNFELVPIMKAVGFGYMEGGSVTLQECKGNPRPWFHRLPVNKSLVVHVGLANKGVHHVIKTISAYDPKQYADFPLNISVAKTNSPEACDEQDAINDYVGSLKALQKANVGTMYTLNISCPNTYGGEPFTTPERLEHLLAAVDELNLAKPVFIKMPIDLAWPEFEKLVSVADKHRVAGLTIGNLAKKRTSKVNDELPAEVKGNLSGKPTQELSNNLIRLTRQNFGDRFIIIGVGGIFTAEDAYIKIKLGADLVELITGMIFQGPQIIGTINRELVTLLQRDGYKNISEAVGAHCDVPVSKVKRS